MTDSPHETSPPNRPEAVASPPQAAHPAAPPPSTPAGSGWKPPRLNPIFTIIIVLIGVLGMLAVLDAWNLWPFTGALERTENAYVRGRTTIISPQVSGYVTKVAVSDYALVKAGQILVTIDDSIYRQRVEQAKAGVDAANANLDNSDQNQHAREAALLARQASVISAEAALARTEADMKRVNDLVTDGSLSVREQDQTRDTLSHAQASLQEAKAAVAIAQEDIRSVIVNRGALRAAVEGAKAALNLAQIELDHTTIIAPQDGQLSDIGVRDGQYVTSGTQLMFLVPPHPWIVANYKEAQTTKMRIGQPVQFTVDALGGALLKGHIEQLSPAAGSEFTVLKPDNATGNFTKVPQRLAVMITVDAGQGLGSRLRPGMSVETTVDTSAEAERP
jgi:multidrug resistance efflux pump